jgi:D-ribose pyranose/furanose isomerase RbsD
MVTLLLDFIKSNPELERHILMTRDVLGDLPLHTAVINGCSVITEKLVNHSPLEALHAENGVGNTPLEIVSLKHTLGRMSMPNQHAPTCDDNHVPLDPEPDHSRLDHLEKNVPELRKVIAALKENGQLTDPIMAEEFAKFARLMETKLTAAKAEAEKANKEEKKEKPVDDFDSYNDWNATLQVIRTAVAAKPAIRTLVHIADVQISVGGHLETAGQRADQTYHRGYRKNNDEGFEAEETEEEKLKKTSRVVSLVNGLTD